MIGRYAHAKATFSSSSSICFSFLVTVVSQDHIWVLRTWSKYLIVQTTASSERRFSWQPASPPSWSLSAKQNFIWCEWMRASTDNVAPATKDLFQKRDRCATPRRRSFNGPLWAKQSRRKLCFAAAFRSSRIFPQASFGTAVVLQTASQLRSSTIAEYIPWSHNLVGSLRLVSPLVTVTASPSFSCHWSELNDFPSCPKFRQPEWINRSTRSKRRPLKEVTNSSRKRPMPWR